MKKIFVKKGLVVAVIFLFITVGFQPIIAENITSVEKESEYNNVDFEQAKEYLFQTILDIANNPDAKNLFKQYNHKILTSDYDYKIAFTQIFQKKPRLLLSILFTKPTITYDYLDKSYKKGIDCVNIVGEEQTLEMIDSIKISNPDSLIQLNNIIKNDKQLSNRIFTLQTMNNNLKTHTPLVKYPIICTFLMLMFIPLFTSFLIFSLFVKHYYQLYPVLSIFAFLAGLVTSYLSLIFFGFYYIIKC